MLPLPRVSSPIAFAAPVPHPSAQPRLDAVQLSSVLLTQPTIKQTLYPPSFPIPVSTCPRGPDLPHPSLLTSLLLNVLHPHEKYFGLVHASQSPASARRFLKSRSRRSLPRSIYLAFLPRHRQMTPSCSMVVRHAHARQFQQTRVKLRCSRAHLPENSSRHSIAAHSIFPFQVSPPI